MIGITNREFPGVIINDPDPKLPNQPKFDIKNRGRYLVHIPELMYSLYDTEYDGILCVNHVTKWRDTYLADNTEKEGVIPTCGSYYPLKTGMHVIVKFFSEDFQSGYIDRIISDYYGDNIEPNENPVDVPEKNSMPVKIKPEERDDYYQIVRTTEDDLIAISTIENNTEIKDHVLPNKSIHIYHRKNVIQIIMDDNGLFINVNDKNKNEVSRDLQIVINGDARIRVEHDSHIEVKNDVRVHVNHDAKIKVNNNCHLRALKDTYIDAENIYQNFDKSAKEENDFKDEFINPEKIPI